MHRAVCRVSRGRVGLRSPKPGGWGIARLTTVGRRTGQQRSVLIGYFKDDGTIVTLAMNGWDAADPAWWLNLQADSAATVDTPGVSREVRARAATGEERARLWARWCEINPQMDALARLRPIETAVVVLEPRGE